MGRPGLNQKRVGESVRLDVRISDGDLAMVAEMARRRGVSRADMVRAMVKEQGRRDGLRAPEAAGKRK